MPTVDGAPGRNSAALSPRPLVADRNRTRKDQWLPRPEGVARLSGAAVTTVAVRLTTTAVSSGSLRAVALPC